MGKPTKGKSAPTPVDRIRKVRVTLAFDDDEHPVEGEFDLSPEEDPVLVAQHLIVALARLRAAERRRRT
ncbi:MAG TPA: hypothetical protein VEW47_10325 [Candidatus Dormibacteraeota bacterium]|nr:hypothetical protein [Candidatus Dormibacteraeota bacterium]